jgi:phosphohistidine phosphatase
MQLYLVRHAIADVRDPLRWPDDSGRPLTQRGIRRFESAAPGLVRLCPKLDRLLTSPLVRARQTADILHAHGWPAPEVMEELRPEVPAVRTLGALAACEGMPCVAMVGHEPAIGEFLSYLLAASETALQSLWRKGGAAVVDLPELRAGAGLLVSYLPPRTLRALATPAGE